MTFLAPRVAMAGQVQAGERRSLPGPSTSWFGFVALSLSIGGLHAAAPQFLASPAATIAAACLMLVFGLPHGTLDLAVIRQAPQRGTLVGVLALYLGLAATMAFTWALSPTLAFLVFVTLSIVHFAEDWQGRLPVIMTLGMAAALVTAPMLTYPHAVTDIFATLIGPAVAAPMVDLLLLLAPMALAIAAAGIAALWQDARRADAVESLIAVLAMLVLPPAIGFALVFCASHAPRQLAAIRLELGVAGRIKQGATIVTFTIIALVAAGLFAWLDPRAMLSDTAVRTAFVTLSVLTLPHMVAPIIARRLFGEAARRL